MAESGKMSNGSLAMNEPDGRTVWIARHGNRADFVDRDWHKTAERPHDPPLSADGMIQAQFLAKRLKGETISHIFASPFLRTIQTASYVAEALDLKIKIEHGVGEWLNPEWFKTAPHLHTPHEMAPKYPCVDAEYQTREPLPWPEQDEERDCWARSKRTIHRLLEEFPGNIVCITHGAAMLGISYGLVDDRPPIHCGLCCVVKAVKLGPRWTLELTGDGSHLVECETKVRLS